MKRIHLALAIVLLFSVSALYANDVNVMDFGASGTGKSFDTEYIQKAIDECAGSGGGVVRVPRGTYLCGTIVLRSGIDLYLDHGAVIKGSIDARRDYPQRALIAAVECSDVRILGPGIIDGQSNLPEFRTKGYGNSDGIRPYLLLFDKCRNISIKDVNLRNAAFWTIRLRRCDGVLIDGITVRSPWFFNNDGIDIDAKNVRVANCLVEALDDGICLKSDDPDFMPENITITNCVIASTCNPIKMGTASYSGFRNVTISNCVIKKPEWDGPWDWSDERFYRSLAPGTQTGLGGVSIECVDGGLVEHIEVSNITMEGIITPIFICLNKRHGAGVMRDIHISNITATAYGIIPCMITGIPDAKISNVSLRDIYVQHEGGEAAFKGNLPENEKGYPENRMYGVHNPACGLFVRHAENIFIQNYQISNRNPDHRPAIVLDDVNDFLAYDVRCSGSDGPLVEQKKSSGIAVNNKQY